MNEWMNISQIISCFFNELEKTHDTYKVCIPSQKLKADQQDSAWRTLWSVGFTEAVTTQELAKPWYMDRMNHDLMLNRRTLKLP